jgi:Na+/proline symporter
LLDFRSSPISDVSDRSSLRRARILTIFFGILGTLLALVVMKHLGTLVQAVNAIFGIFGGPLLGIFSLGVSSRRADTAGALVGALAGAVVGISIAFSGPWFGYGISFMWIPFWSATTTLLVGWLTNFLFAPPDKAAQNLVYRVKQSAQKDCRY